jgi:DNA-binding CsgD family transcriptional regulator
MSSGVVGRDAELASLREFVSSISAGAVALALEGDAGVGKTTLWEAGLEEAGDRRFRVLAARPAESETALSFSGIGDLMAPVLDEALVTLPPAQNRALTRALLLGDDDGPPPDPYAIGLALLNSLRALAGELPVVVAVDDVQWLDPASVGGLAYAARRLRNEPIGLLLSRRSGLESVLVSELRRALPASRVTNIEMGPLDAGALHHVVQSRLGVSLSRPLLSEVRDASGGNPFYALEVVRMLLRTGFSVDTGQPLPVPESLHDLVHGRLLALPRQSRDFLFAAAAHAHPTVAIAEAASEIDRDMGLRPALDARIVELDGDRIRFTHPLLAAGAYETAERTRRAEVHARLAELLDDPEARAWQLAASTGAPDATVADALEQAARHARDRGALRPAALMLDRASELTPADRVDDAVRRAVDAAYLHFESGDSRRAEAQLRDVIAPLPPGPRRARAMVILARIRLYETPHEAADLFAQVVDEAADDRLTLATAHEGAAACCLWMFERFDDVLRHAKIALSLALEMHDEPLAADVLLGRLSAEALLGLPTAESTAEQAAALQDSAADRRVLDQPLVSLAEYWKWVDSHERARAALVDLMRRAYELGDESASPWLLFLLADVERLLGNLETALDRAREGREAAEQAGQRLFARHNLALEGLVYAQLGRPDPARQAAHRALETTRDNYVRGVAAEALGQLDLALGSPADAVAHLVPRLAFARAEAIAEPGATRFTVDLIEALIELGRRDDALEILDWYEGNARRLERASALANCGRCRGLLAAQAGQLDAALVDFEAALVRHDRARIPLDRGRTLLALGAAQRRAKRRREARATLANALAVFEEVGAALWAERARGELRRISGRAPTTGALTPAEERVAALVAEGKTNREVAAALFVSDRTVEGHLSRIFGKLGVKHRTELARALASLQSQGIVESNAGDSPVSAEPAAP